LAQSAAVALPDVPLAIDLFCGLGGWTEALLAAGYYVVGLDIERHVYGEHRYPGQLVIQDVLTLHGSQFRDAALIVASPPCQAYSYRAMPWKRAKALPPPDNTLFEACFRIQREACEAAGRHIPLIVENVRGAQKWVGRARWNYGSFYLWGDVPALMPYTNNHTKVGGFTWSDYGKPNYVPRAFNGEATKVPSFRFDGSGRSFQTASVRRTAPGNSVRFTSRDCGIERQRWFNDGPRTSESLASLSSNSPSRKAASALIAKIPFPLARHIAESFRP
jgi:hypothetical protein